MTFQQEEVCLDVSCQYIFSCLQGLHTPRTLGPVGDPSSICILLFVIYRSLSRGEEGLFWGVMCSLPSTCSPRVSAIFLFTNAPVSDEICSAHKFFAGFGLGVVMGSADMLLIYRGETILVYSFSFSCGKPFTSLRFLRKKQTSSVLLNTPVHLYTHNYIHTYLCICAGL